MKGQLDLVGFGLGGGAGLGVLGVMLLWEMMGALTVLGERTGYPCGEGGRCEACNQCVNGVCQVYDQEENCPHPCQRCSQGGGRCEACNQCVNGVCQVYDQEENCPHPCQRCSQGGGRCEACNQCVNGVCQVYDQEENCPHPCQRCSQGECRWEPELFVNILLQQKCGPFPCESASCPDCHVCRPTAGCVRDYSQVRCRSHVESCIDGECPRCFDCRQDRAGDFCFQNFTRSGCPSAPPPGTPSKRCGNALCPDCHACINQECVPDFVTPRCRGRAGMDKVAPLCGGIPCPNCFVCVSGQCTRDTECGQKEVVVTGPAPTSAEALCGDRVCPPCFGCWRDTCHPVVFPSFIIHNPSHRIHKVPIWGCFEADCSPEDVLKDLNERMIRPSLKLGKETIQTLTRPFINPDTKELIRPGNLVKPVNGFINQTFGTLQNLTQSGNIGVKLCQQIVCPPCFFCDKSTGRCLQFVHSALISRDNSSFICRIGNGLGNIGGGGTPQEQKTGELGCDGGCRLCEKCVEGKCVADVSEPACQSLLGTDCTANRSICGECESCVLGRCVEDLVDPSCRLQASKEIPLCFTDEDCPECFGCASGKCEAAFESRTCSVKPERCIKGNCPLCYDCLSDYCIRNESQQSGCSSVPFQCTGHGLCPYCYDCLQGGCVWDTSCGPRPYPCLSSGAHNGCPDCYKCSFGFCLPDSLGHGCHSLLGFLGR